MKKLLLIVLPVFVLLQVALVIAFGGAPQISDCKAYVDIAERTVALGTWYPTVKDIHSIHIWAPGFINFLIVLKKIAGGVLPQALFMNVLFNALVLLELYALARLFFNEKVAAVAAVLFCCYPVNYGIPLHVFTEPLYCALAYGALWLVAEASREGRPALSAHYPAAGLLLGLSHTVRPLTPPFLLAAFLIIIAGRRALAKRLGLCFAVFFLTVAAAGLISYSRIGYFVPSSTTGGLNMLIGNNDDADGEWTGAVFAPGKAGYLAPDTTSTFKELDAQRRRTALSWILHHPGRYAALLPKKLYHCYASDYFWPVFKDENTHPLLVAGDRWYYFALLLTGIAGAALALRRRSTAGYVLLSLPLTGTLITVLVAYGMDRYRYPYMMAVIILSAYFLVSLHERLTRTPAARPS